jgi:hypothetical protein
VQQRSGGAQFAMKEIDLRKRGLQQAMKDLEAETGAPQRGATSGVLDERRRQGHVACCRSTAAKAYTLGQFLMSSIRLPDAAGLVVVGLERAAAARTAPVRAAPHRAQRHQARESLHHGA